MPGVLLIALFLIVVVILLLNMLIAMMAETFTNVTQNSYDNYALAFSKTLVYMRVRAHVAVPLNLLSVPYYCARAVYVLVRALCTSSVVDDAQCADDTAAGTSAASAAANSPKQSAISQQSPVANSPKPPTSPDSSAPRGHTQRDPDVVQRIDDIRLVVLSTPGKKL